MLSKADIEWTKEEGFRAGTLGVQECHCPYANVGGSSAASRRLRARRRAWIQGQRQGHRAYVELMASAGMLAPGILSRDGKGV